MKDLAAKFHNLSNAGSVEVCYVHFRNVSTFQLDNKINTFVNFLNYIGYVLVPLHIFGYRQSKDSGMVHCLD